MEAPLAHPARLPSHVPPILVGTERLGSVLPDALVRSAEREATFRFLDEVTEAGGTALDVAASYQLGGTERLLGHWMRARKNRARLYLVGKGAHPYPVVRPNRLTPEDLEADLHDSLRRLGTEHLDLYLVHRDAPGAALGPVLDALVRFVREGKIGAYGVSNFHHTRVAALDALAEERAVPRPVASSPQFSLVAWARPQWPGAVSISGDADARAYYARRGLTVLAWSPLGRGFFGPDAARSVYASAESAARRARAETLAQRHGRAVTDVALAYLFAQPFPVHAVVASRSARHMKANLEAATLRLTPDEVRWLERGDAPQREATA